MIVVDTSALLAILQEETAGQACWNLLENGTDIAMSAGTMAEALIVAGRRNLQADLNTLVSDLLIELVPVTAQTAQLCADAHRRWGKGVHPAGLNFGDCFAYALAQERDCPLLFVGNDFSRTDVASALVP